MKNNKDEIITFKVDAALMKAMEGIPNRSEFIRNAVQNAINGLCPLCRGTGVLSPQMQGHWDAFVRTHPLKECETCHALYPVCTKEKGVYL